MEPSGKDKRVPASKSLRLRVTEPEHARLWQEAETCGYDLSTLLRLRIFGKVTGLRIARRPSVDITILSDIIGKLTAITGEVNKIGSNLNQIAKRLNQSSRDVFGLDSSLRQFEGAVEKIFNVLNQIEKALTSKNPNNH